MQVKYVLPGDIINALISSKKRPCIVLRVVENTTVLVVPLTTQHPSSSNIRCSEAPKLLENRFLKEKSYFCFSINIVPLEVAKKEMVGTVSKTTLKFINEKVKVFLNDYL